MPRRESASAPPFETGAALSEWLRGHCVEHLGRLSLGTLTSEVDPELWQELHVVTARRLLVELGSAESVTRWLADTAPSDAMRAILPKAACRYLERERSCAEEARASLAERLAQPPDPRTHRVHALLVEHRARTPSTVAPRAASALALEALRLDSELPGFRFRERRSELPETGAPGFIVPEVRLTFAAASVKTDCTCGRAQCVHALATLDTALLWLRQPVTEERAALLDELVRPGWERTLRAFDGALAETDGGGSEISWRIEVLEGYGVRVAPYVHRRGRKGQRTAGTRVSRRKLLESHGTALSLTDARLAALLPEGSTPASRALLFELVDHPHLHLEEAPDLAVRVERAKVGLVAEDRGGAIVVTAGMDGAALPPSMVERLRSARPDEPLFHWERGSRVLTILDVGTEVRSLLSVLARRGNVFPAESHAALVEKLSALSLRIPVAMPRSVMGEAVPPVDTSVFRLEAQPGGAVSVELRTRPLPDSGTFAPGIGARDVFVRRGTSAVHAVRDLARERAAAEALEASLPFDTAEPEEGLFRYVFPNPQGALALIAESAKLAPPPELEWRGEPLVLLGGRGTAALKVVLERKRSWFGLLGGLSVEGERVELARLIDAARRRERFVKVDARTYVEVEAALRERLEKLADHTHVSRNGLEIGPSGAESLAALGDAGAVVEADDAWRTLTARIVAAKDLKPRVPAALKAVLRDYQVEGFRWLTRLASWNAGGVLADDMGLGKTVQALTVLLDRKSLGPALVVAPTSVAFNWIDEAKRFAPALRLTLYADSADRGATLESLGPKDVLVLSYGLLTRDLERLSKIRFSTIVFDEGQVLKNALTHRFRAARALAADFKFVLSGTPMENHLGELWSLFAIVFPGLLGSWEAFRVRFAGPIEKRTDPTAAPALARVLKPFLLRRTKAQVEAQLPPRMDVRVPVVLSAPEWTLYEDARLAALSDLETRRSKMREQQRHVEVLAALTRLRLLASHPRLHDPHSKLESSKLERFMELVHELRAEGHRALVFSQFTSHLALVREVLDAQGITYEYLDGRTPQGARAARVRAFQDGDALLFLISLKAGGFGLNLTAATSVIHLDPWWNPAVEDQASDRAHRIGQERPVTVYRLVARGTIEEQMLALHEHKRALVAGVLEGKDEAGRLSTEELIGLMSGR